MNLTPQDIQQRKFKKRFRGFDVREVDSFLAAVADSFLALMHEDKRHQERIEELEKIHEQQLADEKIIRAAIIDAEKIADDLKEKSRREAIAYQTKEKEIQDKLAWIEAEKEKNLKEVEALLNKANEEIKTRRQKADEEFAKAKSTREKNLQELETVLTTTKGEINALKEELGKLTKDKDETVALQQAASEELISVQEELKEIKKTKAKVTEELRAFLTQYLRQLDTSFDSSSASARYDEISSSDSQDFIFETDDLILDQGLDEETFTELFQDRDAASIEAENISGRAIEEDDLADLYQSIQLPDEDEHNTIEELSEDLLFSPDEQDGSEKKPADSNLHQEKTDTTENGN
jgi:cell division initiation protein